MTHAAKECKRQRYRAKDRLADDVRDEENPHGDIEIAITGLRPGEKLYEELLIDDTAMSTEHPRIMRARERMWPWAEFRSRRIHTL